MPFKFLAEVSNSGSDRPSSGIAQWANGISFYFFGYIDNEVNIAELSLSVFEAPQYFLDPAGSFPAGRALAATFVVVKPGKIPGIPHDALIFIVNDKSAGTQHRSRHKSAIRQTKSEIQQWFPLLP